MSFRLYAIAVALAVFLAGCATQQPYLVAPQVGDPSTVANAVATAANPQTAAGNASIADAHATAPPSAHPLPYKGRLVDGDPTELPPAVAAALSNNAPLTFTYREELTHDEYHIPYIIAAFDPTNYVTAAPVGDYAVTAHATLTVCKGDRVIADYSDQARVSQSYSFYSEPKHSDVERAARNAVRERIERKLYADADRVTRSISNPSPSVPE